MNFSSLLPDSFFPQSEMAGLMLKVVLFAAFTAFVAVLIAWYRQESFDPESLRGKKVVICGASTGIGEELAYQYSKFGAQLLLVARREAELKKVVARCGELGAESANYVVADLSSLEGAKHLAAETNKEFDGLDILILNHFMDWYEFWNANSNLGKVHRLFAVNTISYITIATLLLPALQKTNGSIIVMSSFAGLVSSPKSAAYSGSKHALHGFFDGMRQDLALKGHSGISTTLCVLGIIGTKNALERMKGHQIENVAVQWESVDDCATAVIKGSTLRKRQIYFPQYLSIVETLHFFFPNFVESAVQVLTKEKPLEDLWKW